MILNIAEGIEIVINDDIVKTWESSRDKRYLYVWTEDENGSHKYVWDREKHIFYEEGE